MLIRFSSVFIYGLFNDVLSSSPELLIAEVNLYHIYTICIPPPHIPACAKFIGGCGPVASGRPSIAAFALGADDNYDKETRSR
jgi:hypothetical protein